MKKAGIAAIAAWILLLLCACAAPTQAERETENTGRAWASLTVEREWEMHYAQQLEIGFCADGFKRITIGGSEEYLVVPEGEAVPDGVPDEVTVLRQPLDRIYLVTSASMDYLRALDEIGAVRLSGQRQDAWYIPEAAEAMKCGEMLYAGKYSAPDYELILSEGCNLAVENTMIYHSPKVLEQLQAYGIPVLVDRSSYESDPLGRMEWIKLYAALLNREEEADAIYNARLEALAPVLQQEKTGKTVAFFYITSSGTVSVRKSGDYIAKSIELAGGDYIFSDLGDESDAKSTMTIQMEAFYAAARDADVWIYSGSITGGLHSMDDLLALCPMLADCKPVQTGSVWCTDKNLYQESLGVDSLIRDLHAILTENEAEELAFLYKLS